VLETREETCETWVNLLFIIYLTKLTEPRWLIPYSDDFKAGQPRNRGSIFWTGSGYHSISYNIGTGAVSPMVRRQGREAYHSPLYKLRMVELYLHSPRHLHGVILN
jgi:hypothetical protein